MYLDKQIVIHYSHKSEGEKLFESLASDHYAEPDQESILFQDSSDWIYGSAQIKKGESSLGVIHS